MILGGITVESPGFVAPLADGILGMGRVSSETSVCSSMDGNKNKKKKY